MNLDHVKILAWEHYRRCLKTVVPATCLFAFLLISTLLIDKYDQNTYRVHGNADEVGMIFTIPTMIIVSLMLLISNTSDKELNFAMGSYYLRLPIKAWHLAAIRITLNMLTLISVIFVMGSITIYFYNLSFPDPISWLSILSDAELLNASVCTILFVYLIIQVLAWTFSTVTVFISTLVLWYFFARHFDWFLDNNAFLIGTGIGYFVSIGLAGFSLRYARSDEPLPFTLAIRSVISDLLELIGPRADKSNLPFDSPKDAQYWLERRSMLNAYKNATVIFLLIFISMLSYMYATSRGIHNFRFVSNTLIGAAFMSIIFTMILVGISNGLSTFRRQTTSLKDFIFTKPITSRQIARSRTRALLSIVWLPCILFLAIGLYFCYMNFVEYARVAEMNNARNSELIQHFDYALWARTFTIGAISAYIALLCAVWCFSWIMHSIPSLLILWVLFFAAELIGDIFKIRDYPFGVQTLGVLIALSPILYIWKYSYKKDLLMVPSKILWLIPVLAFAILLSLIGNRYWNEDDYAGALFVATLVFAPIASAPASVHWARHQ